MITIHVDLALGRTQVRTSRLRGGKYCSREELSLCMARTTQWLLLGKNMGTRICFSLGGEPAKL